MTSSGLMLLLLFSSPLAAVSFISADYAGGFFCDTSSPILNISDWSVIGAFDAGIGRYRLTMDILSCIFLRRPVKLDFFLGGSFLGGAIPAADSEMLSKRLAESWPSLAWFGFLRLPYFTFSNLMWFLMGTSLNLWFFLWQKVKGHMWVMLRLRERQWIHFEF